MLNILDWLRDRSPQGRYANEVYGSIVAQGRDPVFYTDFGVEDVAEKRYELIVLHMVLVLERLRELRGEVRNGAEHELAQALTETFVRDLDGSMREMAVGDTKVPAKVRKAAGGLYDRDFLYRDAFAVVDDGEAISDTGLTLAGLVEELLFEGRSVPEARALAAYTLSARAELQAWSPFPGNEETGRDQPMTLPRFPRTTKFLNGEARS